MLTDPVIASIAERVGRTPAQVILRWHVELGNVVIPKSVTPARIAENIDVFDFSLTADDHQAIAGLETGERIGPQPGHLQPRLSSRLFRRTPSAAATISRASSWIRARCSGPSKDSA